jgi:DNA repair protein RecN (Recombination protein N)
VRPLRHVASGGEAARIMLALRSVLSVGPAPAGRGERTLIFDEIDSGVGGHLAPKVAKHLRTLASGDQVLCVTHLPAIAAAADLHLKVRKELRRGRSRTVVGELEGEDRVLEVADMIGGGAGHETARAEARRLLGIG